MRERKIRAWDEKAKKMLFFENPSACEEYRSLSFFATKKSLDEKGDLPNSYSINTPNGKKDYYILMDFICAKDWRGREIFEDDIICVNRHGKEDFIGKVKYSIQMSGFYITSGAKYVSFGDCGQNWIDQDPNVVYMTNTEVVGNVYENPELLNQ